MNARIHEAKFVWEWDLPISGSDLEMKLCKMYDCATKSESVFQILRELEWPISGIEIKFFGQIEESIS